MIQLDVDVVTDLKNLLPSYYDLIVPSLVIDELAKLKKKSKGKDKIAASVAYKIACNEPFKNVYIKKTDHVDNLLLDYCTDNDVRILRKRARKRGITVIYLRQHRFLEVDGYIKRNSTDDN